MTLNSIRRLARPVLLLLLVFALVPVLGLGCRGAEKPLEKVSVALDWYPNSNHAGLFLAQTKGYFRDEGLEVNMYTPSDPSAILQTVGADKDDFGVSYQSDVLLARAEKVPVVSIAGLVQHPLNSVMALKGSNIRRPRELMGKKVGYPGIPTDPPLLKTMVEKDGGDFAKVELVNIGFDLVAALLGRKVDAIVGAYWTHENILIEQQGEQVTILRMEEWGVPDFYELVLVANEKTLRERPGLVEKFLRATLKGYQDALADLDGALENLVKVNPEVDRALEQRGIRLLAPVWKDGVPVIGWQTAQRWRGFADWMKANGLLDTSVEPGEAFTNRFVEELEKGE
ncbi:MAG: ABC transporter substrate-binding protein [Chloroflexi bacterium]|nr:ABC transporter substrate-binding protein [Chloroflexota bacterium]